MPAPAEIKKLVEKFAQHREDYVSGKYNETMVRRDFIDPFLRALGWDVDNTEGASERYREVVHEDRVRVGGESKAPDYSCRLGGNRIFFVEAKKPSVDLKDDPGPAFQLRRYAWSAKLPVSVLTDFEELVIYDTTAKPAVKDKATVDRLRYWTSDQYVEQWDEIAGILSKESVKSGAFDKFAGERKRKAVTQVDDDFLAAIEEWRDLLARDLAKENPKLDSEELSFAVQRILDRIVFLRICEDRGIESAGQLHALVNGPHIYARLKELFDRADKRYNSGLFHFKEEKRRHESPDSLTPKLKVSDKALKTILDALYVNAPWVFGVIPADILGSIYEQFLGKVIHRDGRGVRIEEKPEVKKAGGVYYTPKYIVDYIVKETVGKLLEGKSPKEAAEIKVLDPACGSGSFLIGAYQYLLDWHLDQYLKAPEKQKKQLTEFPKGVWRLSSAERKRILTNSIYGVDIDPQAVEVTKLSLLLKVLEGESAQSLQIAFELLPQRALPDLGDNIKCGNSLVAPGLTLLPGIGGTSAGSPFDWNREFAEIVGSSGKGFSAVIGNPPYVRQEGLKTLKEYFANEYESFSSGADLLVYFFERGICLLGKGGRLGFISSSSFLRAGFGKELRSFLGRRVCLESIVDFGGYPVFDGAKDTYVCVPIFIASQAGGCTDSVAAAIVDSGPGTDLGRSINAGAFQLQRARLTDESWPIRRPEEFALLERIASHSRTLLDALKGHLFYGLKTGLNRAFVVNSDDVAGLVGKQARGAELLHPWLGGEDIRAFHTTSSGKHLIAVPAGWTRRKLFGSTSSLPSEKEAWHEFSRHAPGVADHLLGFQAEAKGRDDQGDFWWELRPCDYYDVLDGPKLVFPDIAKGPRFSLERAGAYLGNTGYCAPEIDHALLGYLNSRVSWFTISMTSIPFGFRAGAYRYRLIYQYMAPLPIPLIVLSDDANPARERVASLAKAIESLDAEPLDNAVAQGRQRGTLQAQLDESVCSLLQLSPQEEGVVRRAAMSIGDED